MLVASLYTVVACVDGRDSGKENGTVAVAVPVAVTIAVAVAGKIAVLVKGSGDDSGYR